MCKHQIKALFTKVVHDRALVRQLATRFGPSTAGISHLRSLDNVCSPRRQHTLEPGLCLQQMVHLAPTQLINIT